MAWFVVVFLAVLLLWAFTREAKPKRIVSERRESVGNLGKVINYDQGRGIRKEKIGGNAELKLAAYLDVSKAHRLIDNIQAKYPDKSRDWCAAKALEDWQRDRQVT